MAATTGREGQKTERVGSSVQVTSPETVALSTEVSTSLSHSQVTTQLRYHSPISLQPHVAFLKVRWGCHGLHVTLPLFVPAAFSGNVLNMHNSERNTCPEKGFAAGTKAAVWPSTPI